MKIKFITPQIFDDIMDIYTNFPKLIFENKGYGGINRSTFSEEEKKADAKINNILSNHIAGFSEFQNFNHDKDGNITLRFQYNYGYDGQGISFIGVGYLTLDELLNGFKN